jgi:hypothetical protein
MFHWGKAGFFPENYQDFVRSTHFQSLKSIKNLGGKDMKLNTIMIITAIVAFIFGLAFILVPAIAMGFYGNTLDVVGSFLGRYFGAALIGYAFLAWLNRDTTSRAVKGGFFVAMALGFAVSLYDALAGVHNGLVWLNVAIYLLLGIGFGYFFFMKEEMAQQP